MKEASFLVDSGAIHNFINPTIANCLGKIFGNLEVTMVDNKTLGGGICC